MPRPGFVTLLSLALLASGCASTKSLAPPPALQAAVEQAVQEAIASLPPAPIPAAPTPALPAVALPSPPDRPSAADLAQTAKRTPDPVQEALRAAWKEFKGSHVPAQLLTIAINRAIAEQIPDLSMPPDPGQLDVSTGGLGALIVALVALLLKRFRQIPSSK